MAQRYRKRPLAAFEHGTRIYAPSEGEDRHRVVARDAATDERIFLKVPTEEEARLRAREIEERLASPASVREPHRWSRTVEHLSRRYVEDYLSAKSNRLPGEARVPASQLDPAGHR